eukprot:561788-Pelagomonas_calceolata.AAC.2
MSTMLNKDASWRETEHTAATQHDGLLSDLNYELYVIQHPGIQSRIPVSACKTCKTLQDFDGSLPEHS